MRCRRAYCAAPQHEVSASGARKPCLTLVPCLRPSPPLAPAPCTWTERGALAAARQSSAREASLSHSGTRSCEWSRTSTASSSGESAPRASGAQLIPRAEATACLCSFCRYLSVKSVPEALQVEEEKEQQGKDEEGEEEEEEEGEEEEEESHHTPRVNGPASASSKAEATRVPPWRHPAQAERSPRSPTQ